MTYRVVGTGADGIELEYEKATKNEAINLAVKMGSNGVDDARVLDRNGREIKLDNLRAPSSRRA
jgi:hypothetical protein